MRRLTAYLALWFFAPLAFAAATDGSFAVDGPGSQTCSSFLTVLKTDNKAATIAFAAWTEGFVTGVNAFRDQTYDVTPWQTTPLLLAKMRVFCESNPEMPYVNALGRLIATLMPGRSMVGSKIVQVRHQGKAVALPLGVLASVRAALEKQGAKLATPANAFDGDFALAIMEFQAAEGLVQTGLPDQPTLNALFP